MSYNIRYSGASKDTGDRAWEVRRPATLAMIADIKPDVFGVQEAKADQVQYLKENCQGYDLVGVGRKDGISGGEHMLVCWNTSTVEKLDWGTFWLSDTPDEPSYTWGTETPRSTTWAKMKHLKTGRTFFFICTHLHHKFNDQDPQKKSLALIISKMAELNPEGLPVILTGDFNINPDHYALEDLDKVMRSARTYSIYETDHNITFNDWSETPETYEIIDYVYYKGMAGSLRFKRITKPYEGFQFISDHYPVVAELIF